MANPLYNMMQNNDLITRFNQFRQGFKGNPQETIQQLMSSGRISQEQYNQAVRMAQKLRGILGR